MKTGRNLAHRSGTQQCGTPASQGLLCLSSLLLGLGSLCSYTTRGCPQHILECLLFLQELWDYVCLLSLEFADTRICGTSFCWICGIFFSICVFWICGSSVFLICAHSFFWHYEHSIFWIFETFFLSIYGI